MNHKILRVLALAFCIVLISSAVSSRYIAPYDPRDLNIPQFDIDGVKGSTPTNFNDEEIELTFINWVRPSFKNITITGDSNISVTQDKLNSTIIIGLSKDFNILPFFIIPNPLSVTLDQAYDAEGGTRTINVDDGSIQLTLSNTHTFTIFDGATEKFTVSAGAVPAIQSVELAPLADNTHDLGSVFNKWKNFYLAGNLTDGTDSLTVANAKTAFDHVTSNNDDHSHYIFNAPAASARNIIQPSSPSVVPLTLRGAVSQTANSFTSQDDSNNVTFFIDVNGGATFNNQSRDNNFLIKGSSTDALFVDAANNRRGYGTSSPQTPDHFAEDAFQMRWERTAGQPNTYDISMTSSQGTGAIGSLLFRNVQTTANIAFAARANGTAQFIINGSQHNTIVSSTGSGLNQGFGVGTADDFTDSRVLLIGFDTAKPVLIVRAPTAHADNIEEWQDIGENVLVAVDETGQFSLLQDNKKIFLGAAQDASVSYDGTDLVINPKEVGSGITQIQGDVNIVGDLNLQNSDVTEIQLTNTDTTLTTDQTVARINIFQNDSSVNGQGIKAAIRFYSPESGGNHSAIGFMTSNNQSATATEHLTIASNGRVGVSKKITGSDAKFTAKQSVNAGTAVNTYNLALETDQNNANTGGGIIFTRSATSNFWRIKAENAGGTHFFRISNFSASTMNDWFVITHSNGKTGVNNPTPTAQHDVNSFSSTIITQILRGSPGQSADIQRIQDSDGNIFVQVEANGNVNIEKDLNVNGDVFFGTGGGLSYGEISIIGNTTETAISTQNVFVQVIDFNVNGLNNNTTPDHTNNHVTINVAGVYFITMNITIDSVMGAGATFELEVQKNNGASRVGAVHGDRSVSGGGGETGSITITGIARLETNDTIELWIQNETGTQNIIIEDAVLSMVQVGG